MNTQTKSNTHIYVMAATAIGVALIIGLSFIFVSQRNDKFKRDKGSAEVYLYKAEVERAKEQKADLNACLAEAETRYQQYWDDTVATFGNKADRTLPSPHSETVNKALVDWKDTCFKTYPQ